MPTALPVVRGLSAALYPFEMRVSFDTAVQQFENAAQQRWARRTGLVKVSLNWDKMTRSQRDTLKAAFTSAKGQFDTTLSIQNLPFAGSLATFFNFGFDSDEFASVESAPTRYGMQVSLTQSLTQSLSPGTAGTAFPTLANGTMGILPYTQGKRFQTLVSQMAAGPRYTYAQFSGGLSGFPTDGLLSWRMDQRMLTDADSTTLINHFIANYGRLKNFQFTDEDGTVFSNIHYASDELAVTYAGVNNVSLTTSLEQTN